MTDLTTRLGPLTLQNPVLLASGTAAYGRELADVMDLEALGGVVTKAVSVEPRTGAPAPRVADFDGGMINAVGLANPGVEAVCAEDLPWIATHVRRPRVLVNVVGREAADFGAVVARMDGAPGFDGFELNVSCPNVKQGGMEFGADPEALRAVVSGARGATRKPIFVKLSPTLPRVGDVARQAVDAGADGITVINTIPGLVIDLERRRPMLGFGSGGVSGPGLLAVGVLATWRVRQAVSVPIIGAGGVQHATDVLQYLMAGASAVAIGTAGLADPKLPGRVIRDLGAWAERHGIARLADLIGTLEWPS
ncbi:MAG: dihydroorotate dehydrogenase [Gemmatimonadota bacterium]|nr:dihydroorotate dehydrogenase [Gemmatimonadota bacterium]MDQ8146769.1 dihydroorotate dehydrogenase [Gemmatimonadota bacterium]MDQ8148919.1 dihydroorotate dehydrogenase [Gemmatimonadota bacterium]MDQ8157403.1 dihydroorotate dehydrogenase [Gemmatimonadota bacterium]MDQ8176122.1 dihydroorotate dehydrogenase [Gemmatimonadota bacterium]